jgi:hypothetical protein
MAQGGKIAKTTPSEAEEQHSESPFDVVEVLRSFFCMGVHLFDAAFRRNILFFGHV